MHVSIYPVVDRDMQTEFGTCWHILCSYHIIWHRFPPYRSVSVPTMLRPSAPFETSAFIWTLMRPWRHTSPELLQAVSASCISCGASKGRCLVILLCRSSPVLCWQSSITVICCWSAFLQSSWTDSTAGRHQHRSSFGLSCYEGRSHNITPVLKDLHWLRIQERILYKLCVLVFKCRHQSGTNLPVRPTSTSRSNGVQTSSEII